jgi:hypothetical protein
MALLFAQTSVGVNMRDTSHPPGLWTLWDFGEVNILLGKSICYAQFFALLSAIFPVIFLLVKSEANPGTFQVKSQLAVGKNGRTKNLRNIRL